MCATDGDSKPRKFSESRTHVWETYFPGRLCVRGIKLACCASLIASVYTLTFSY